MDKLIVITNLEIEVEYLQKWMKQEFNNVGFWNKPIMDYNCEWYWVINGKDISGTSGYNSLKHTIITNPGFRIFYFNDFKLAL